MDKTERFMMKAEAFMQKTTNFQIQQTSIQTLEKQVGQLAKMMQYRPFGTVPNNIETKLKEQVNAIITRNGVQLPRILGKRPIAIRVIVPSIDEEQVEQSEQVKCTV
ncbi:Uncharacterized protein Adt_31365 [Abeliophyllum distichum]|uniref:Uncharacterized protein n=1 Tax=Abeliophyllum distichum TaxID=126358 RepID=A0ABD1RHG7_9LAMI